MNCIKIMAAIIFLIICGCQSNESKEVEQKTETNKEEQENHRIILNNPNVEKIQIIGTWEGLCSKNEYSGDGWWLKEAVIFNQTHAEWKLLSFSDSNCSSFKGDHSFGRLKYSLKNNIITEDGLRATQMELAREIVRTIENPNATPPIKVIPIGVEYSYELLSIQDQCLYTGKYDAEIYNISFPKTLYYDQCFLKSEALNP